MHSAADLLFDIFGKEKKSYVQLLQYGHPLTRAAQTALPVVQGGIEPIEVGSQTEV